MIMIPEEHAAPGPSAEEVLDIFGALLIAVATVGGAPHVVRVLDAMALVNDSPAIAKARGELAMMGGAHAPGEMPPPLPPADSPVWSPHAWPVTDALT